MDDSGSPMIGIIVLAVLLILSGMTAAYVAAVEDDSTKKYSRTAQMVWNAIHLVMGAYVIDFLAQIIINHFPGIEMLEIAVFGIYAGLTVAALLFSAVCIFTGQKVAVAKEKQCEKLFMPMIKAFTVLLMPLQYLANVLANILSRIFGVDPNDTGDDVTEEEIISMVNEGHEQGVINANEAEMITNIFEFGDKEAQDIMTHRKNMDMLSGEWSFSQAMDVMLEGNNSRFPVYVEDMDNIIGVVHIKDVMLLSRQEGINKKKIKDIENLVRSVDFIPETRNINALFQSMQISKSHMVIVVDEYGQTTGLVTMEDILEEIVGNIMDEYDEEETMFVKEEDGSYTMSGMADLEDIEDELGIVFELDDYETLNGFLIAAIDTIPENGKHYEVQKAGYNFEILTVDNKMIQTVRVTRIEDSGENSLEIHSCEKEQEEGTN